jgi:MFS family permease
MIRVQRLYILFQVFFANLLWLPIFYEFQKNLGLVDSQIFNIQSLYYLAFILFELPTGSLADRYGYRRSMQLGAGVLIFANLLPPLASGFYGMLLHFLAIAAARSLISGAASAYIYEYLKSQKRIDDYRKIEGRARSYGLIVKVLCWSSVGYLVSLDFDLPYYLTAFNALAAFICATGLPGEVLKKSAPPTGATPPRPSFKNSLQDILKSPAILQSMFLGAGVFVLVRLLQVNLFQPVLISKQFDIIHFGWIMSIMTIFEALGNQLSHHLRRRTSDQNLIIGATLVLCLMVGGLPAIAPKSLVVLSLCVFSVMAGCIFPAQKQLVNDSICAHQARATILSIESILNRSLCALFVLPMGYLLEDQRLSMTLVGSGVIVAFGTILLYSLIHYRHKIKD